MKQLDRTADSGTKKGWVDRACGNDPIITKEQRGAVNKLELVKTLMNRADITKTDAATIVDLFFDEMTTAMEKGDRVEVRGLCSFYIKKYNSYTGRNPKTGEKVQIKPKKLPFFKCGKELKDRVDY